MRNQDTGLAHQKKVSQNQKKEVFLFRKTKLLIDATKTDESLGSVTIVGFGLVILVGYRYVLTNRNALNEKLST